MRLGASVPRGRMHTSCDVRRVSPESADCVHACLFPCVCTEGSQCVLVDVLSYVIFFMFVCIAVPISVFMSVSDAGV